MGFVKKTTVFVVLLGVVLYLVRQWCNGPMCDSDVRLDGKVAIVTGANTGIGLETAVDLVARGARVYLACRSVVKGEAASAQIEARTGRPAATRAPVMKLDLSSLTSVRNFVSEFKQRENRLDLLINNAGVALLPNRTLTEDGFEMTFGTNHLGHFLLTNLLLDMLKASAPSRVVTVSSKAHRRITGMQWEDLMFEQDGSYDGLAAYAQSKLANILFSVELGRRLQGTGITAYSLHPGVIITEIIRHMEFHPWVQLMMDTASYHGLLVLKDLVDGAQTTICCAVDEKLKDESGKYYRDCHEFEPSSQAMDEEAARKLWEISEELVKLQKEAATQTS